MTPEQIAQILDDLGSRLGPTGRFVFDLAVRQVFVDAAASVVSLIGLAVIGLVVGPRVHRWVQGGDSYSSRELAGMLLGITYGFAVLSGVIAVAFTLPKVFNPEYAAIQGLLGAIGK